jgi:broad specificity phosphatase PhoE
VEPLTIERNLGSLTNTIQGDGKITTSITTSGKSKVEWVPPEGESTIQVYQRALVFLNKIKQRSEKNILICGHQNFLRCLELAIRDGPIDDEHFYSETPRRLNLGEVREYKLD